MLKVKVLGMAGSPRKNGNTTKLVKRALDGAKSVPGVETEMYELGGKKFHHCTGCLACAETGECVFKDDLGEFINKYMQADGVIWGSPIYHMSITGLLKNAIDRMGNSTFCKWAKQGLDFPRFSKVCGTLTVGFHHYGGQDFVNMFMINSSLVMNGVVVSGDTLIGNYIGAAGNTVELSMERLKSRDGILENEEALNSAENLGKRVAEMTRIVKAGLLALKDELPKEYLTT